MTDLVHNPDCSEMLGAEMGSNPLSMSWRNTPSLLYLKLMAPDGDFMILLLSHVI